MRVYIDQSVEVLNLSFPLYPDYMVSLGLEYVSRSRRVATVEVEKPVTSVHLMSDSLINPRCGFLLHSNCLQRGIHVQNFNE